MYLTNILEARAYKALEKASWIAGLECPAQGPCKQINRSVGTRETENAAFVHALNSVTGEAFKAELSTLFRKADPYNPYVGRAVLAPLVETKIIERSLGSGAVSEEDLEEGDDNRLVLVLPPVESGGNRNVGFAQQAIGVRINARLRPLTPFLPSIRVRGEAWGFREKYAATDTTPYLDCLGRPYDPHRLPSTADCVCPTTIDETTGQCICNDPYAPVKDTVTGKIECKCKNTCLPAQFQRPDCSCVCTNYDYRQQKQWYSFRLESCTFECDLSPDNRIGEFCCPKMRVAFNRENTPICCPNDGDKVDNEDKCCADALRKPDPRGGYKCCPSSLMSVNDAGQCVCPATADRPPSPGAGYVYSETKCKWECPTKPVRTYEITSSGFKACCPGQNQTLDASGNCINQTCNGGTSNPDGTCKCPPNYTNDNGTCVCSATVNPPNTLLPDGVTCCPSNRVKSAGGQTVCCPNASQELTAAGTCGCEADEYRHENNANLCCSNQCEPDQKRRSNDSCDCVCEPKNCPSPRVRPAGTCECNCPYAEDAQGGCCKEDQHVSRGICCYEGFSESGGICCRDGLHNDGGLCCAADEYNSRGKCCKNNEVNDNGSCILKADGGGEGTKQ